MKIEAGKTYQTRNGKKATVTTRTNRAFPIEGEVDGKLECWLDDGTYRVGVGNHPLDLVAEWYDATSIDGLTEMYGDVAIEPREIAPAATGYGDLHAILQDAFDQSASGKGRERHANDKPFDRQPIMEIGRMVGPGYAIGQAMKKLQEAMTMQSRDQHDAADRELLGSIVYAAAAVKLIRENRAA